MIKYNRILLLIVVAALCTGCKQSKPIEKKSSAIIEHATIDKISDEETKQLLSANWKISRVSDAVVYKYHHFDNLFDSNQSVTLIDVDLNKNISVDIPYVTSGFIKTSEAAANMDATAAINGSYFNTSSGGSTVFFKKDNKIIKSTQDSSNSYRENAGFAMDASGKVSIIRKPAAGWKTAEASTLLTSGPLLVYDGKVIEQVDAKFNTNRHPRTAVGITEKNHLLAVVIDGRNRQAHGMTTEEVSILMLSLGCKEAMNLDGGGSSTAWVKNLGVVNYPSDNKRFDLEGERGVATVITFTQK